ncbi:MAG: cca [Dehalococcoidales bacterium]|nr:cca [Dehalococcoidales bacterium]
MNNLASRMAKQLPAGLVEFLPTVGEIAAAQGQNLYLVGGVVRDLLLERRNLDLDLVVEGDAINLARRLADITQGKLITHSRFNTAKLKWDNWSLDLATARSETYDRPGALPRVKPGSLSADLFRRDFTINAMAIELVPTRYGQLVDLYRGRHDLEHKLIRILHEKSFIDDATRLWRGLRYEQRLGFSLETNTLELAKRDIPMLATISGDRIRHELELALEEEFPEKVLRRAQELGVLSKLHPGLSGDDWLVQKFGQVRQLSLPVSASLELYLALLAYRLTDEETDELIAYLRLPKSITLTLRDSASLKVKLGELADPDLGPSAVYRLLHGYTATAITTNSLATDSAIARQYIELYLSKLRYIKPVLTGNDLLKLGIPSGPRMKEILQRLHEARLDGKVTSKQGEIEIVRGWRTIFPPE